MSAVDRLEAAREQMLGDCAARQRIAQLLDQNSFVELDSFVVSNSQKAGVVCGFGSVMGSPVAVFSQDITADGGAVGKAHAAKIAKVLDTAAKTGIPVVGIYDSHGALAAENIGALAAYGELLLRMSNLSGVVPQISVVLGACAGTAAMLAAGADFVLMSEKAEFFTTSSDGESASAKNAAESGVAHVVCKTQEDTLLAARKLLTMLPLNNLATAPVSDFARETGKTYDAANSKELLKAVCDGDSAIELMPDFGQSAVTVLATMGGYPCGMVVTMGEKLCADTCAKIAKFVGVLDSFQIPVLTFVNTPGMAAGKAGGAVREMAKLAHVYAEATTAKIAVITGKAYGAAYIALAGRAANADYCVAWPTAVISALEPVTMVALLKGDEISKTKSREQLESEYIENEANPLVAAGEGYIDDIIAPEVTRPALLAALDLFSAKRVRRNPKKHSNIPM